MSDDFDRLEPGDALLIVDVQRDFCAGGALPVPDGDAVIPVLNTWASAAQHQGARIYASRDWHPREHPSFHTREGEWPPHCIQDTSGAAFHPDLKLPDTTITISKGTRLDRDQYSAFDATGLADDLHAHGIRRVWVGGLAEDVCVRATALDAQRAGFETHVIRAATRPLSPEGGRATERELSAAGVAVE